MQANERKLRGVLKTNAAFSMISGMSLIIFHHSIASVMHVSNSAVLQYLGIGLVLFSASVAHASLRKTLVRTQVKSIIVQDWAWVLASVLVIVSQSWQLSSTGYWLIGLVAMIVASFAIFQMRFLKRL